STGGYGLLVHAMPGPVTWTGFTVRYTGNTGVAVYPVGGDIERLTLKGLVTEAGLHLGYDPHAEKGTGIHAWNIADGKPGHVVETAGAYSGARYALSSVYYGRSTGPILQNKRLSRVAYNVGDTGLKLPKVAPHS